MIAESLPQTVPAASAVALALQATRDTVVMVQATPTGWAFWADLLTSIATVVIALGLIGGGLAAIPLARLALSTLRQINRLLTQVQNDIAPLIKHGHAVTENLDYISTSVRMDVQRVSQTVASANQRVERVAAQAEQRINEFNALLKVMQEEAEDLFIDTAATVRGVQVGADVLRGFRSEPEPDEAAPAPEIRVQRTSRDRTPRT